MKVIDLLNKIAKGEEVPQYIRFKGNNYNCYYDGIYNYYVKENSTDLLMEKITDTSYLNEEVEIIEEEKGIPEKLPKSITDNACSSKDDRLIANTINEIIDYLNKENK